MNISQAQNLHWSLQWSVLTWFKLHNPPSYCNFIQASGLTPSLRQILVNASGFVTVKKNTKHRQLQRPKIENELLFSFFLPTFDLIVYTTCIDTVISWRAASASSCFVLSKMLCSSAFLFSSSTRALASFSFETPAYKIYRKQILSNKSLVNLN